MNEKLKVIIVGGVAAGAAAAARIRRLNEDAEVIVFERSGFISYANCGLPYYIGGIIENPEELTLQTPESFWERFRIDMRVHHEVTELHPERKTISVRNLKTGEIFEEAYDKLLLSPGAKPVLPPLSGMDADKLFTLRTVEDTLAIHQFIETEKPKSAILAGGGFIGIELAENLRELGLDVTIVQRPKQLMNPLDADMAAFIHGKMRSHGIHLKLGSSVEGFTREERGMKVLLKNEAPLHADMVILAIGVTPDTRLAEKAGLKLGLKGTIEVNERMETSAPDIYAAGDAVQVKHFVTGKNAVISLAGPAAKQGRIAADNICGGNSVYRGSQGSSIIKIFDMTAAVTGINETAAKRAGIEYEKIYLSPADHAGYYPGGKLMTMKVLFEKGAGKLLGAQIVGFDGVDKRIDVLAAAIRGGLTAPQLAELDLAYAPPYSSAKDPVNMAGFMADNIVSGRLKQFHLEDLTALTGTEGAAAPADTVNAAAPADTMNTAPESPVKTCSASENKGFTLLDVRTEEEYAAGHAKGFVNIPVDALRERISELNPKLPVYVMCQSGLRSYIACRILTRHGFTCYNFSGGYRLYQTVTEDKAAAETASLCGKEI